MGARWDVAAAIIALLAIFAQVLSSSPAAAAFFYQTVRRVICFVQPERGRCRRLRWEDIPDGQLHQCNPPALCPHDLPPGTFPLQKNCWEDTIGQVFTKMWTLMKKSPTNPRFVVAKPYHLPLDKEYVQMDIKTLKAYIMLAIEICDHTCEGDKMRDMLGIERHGQLVTVQLNTLIPIPRNCALTKLEVDRLVEGYPPFYRETFKTTGGITLPHPTTRTSQFGRGAWIFAVGASNTMGTISGVHNMQSVTEKRQEPFWKGTMVMTAFRHIRRNVELIKEYGNGKEIWSEYALDCYDLILSDEYALLPWPLKVEKVENSILFSGMIGPCPCQTTCLRQQAHSASCGRGQDKRKDPAKRLNEEECRAALDIFSNYQLSDQNLAIIYPKLEEVLRTVILGMMEVENYFSDKGRKLELPGELADKKFVYARQCSKIES